MVKAYAVLEKYDSMKNYGLDIRPQYAKCLAAMKKGEKINSKQFIKEHRNEFTQRRNTLEANQQVIYKAFSIGKKIGILKETLDDSVPISFKDFCKLETVSYFRNQLRGSNRKNISSGTDGTKDTYTRHLHYFNSWIFGKTLEYIQEVQVTKENYRKEKKKTVLKGVEHFLEIYAENHFDKKPFVRMIKSYFLEPDIKSMGKSTKNVKFFAINEYFTKNEEPLTLSFDPNAGVQLDNDDSEQIMSLDEFLKILTIGKPSLTEKAAFMCKFQRGLDSSTLVDRFNFETWPQLVKAFGTAEYEKWDL